MPDPSIALTMIIRNEQDTIGALLDSVLPHVDRAVIHDTGSTDDTVPMVREAFTRHGMRDTARVRAATWPDDFAAARQSALNDLLDTYPEVTHVFWCDGDDLVVGAAGLRDLAGQMHPPVGALLMHYAYATDPAGNLSCSHFRERLIRVDAIDRWVGSVHEVLTLKDGWQHQPAAAPDGSGLTGVPGNTWGTAPGGIEVIHTRPPGKDTTGRNLRILEATHQANITPDPRVMFYLAQEYAIRAAGHANAGDHDRYREDLRLAVDTLSEYDTVAGWDQERYQARHRRADYLRALGDHQAALTQDLEAISLLPDWPDAWHGAAESYLHTGNPAAAIAYTDAGLSKPYPQTMLILNPLDYTCAPYVTRAHAHHQAGDHGAALTDIRRALAVTPYDQALTATEDEFQTVVNHASIRDAVLALDETLARHDENLKAAALLESAVPYFLTDDPVIAERRRRRRAGVRHVRGGEYTRFYQDDNPVHPIEESIGDGRPFLDAIQGFCSVLPRAQFLHRMLTEHATRVGREVGDLRVVDIGCNDGWLGWWLTTTVGVGSYDGYDLSAEAIRVARGYATRPGLGDSEQRTRFHVGVGPTTPGTADVVVCFEVLEHVPDAADHLRFLSSHATEGGVVVVSTPNGAWERGHIQDWDSPEPRGHVRALPTRDVASLILDAGVMEALEETTDRLVVAAYRPAERTRRLDMYLGAAAGMWSPLDPVTRGLGGSETMAVRMATELAARGWRVRVYAQVAAQTVAQVEYLPHHMFDPTDPRDVLIASRTPWVIRDQPEGRRILWLHDAEYPGLQDLAPLWDEVWTVGSWQAENLPLGDVDVRVTRNAIPLDRYQDGSAGFTDREPALIYSSCPSRGLTHILDAWPEILERCGERGVNPVLHIAYGFTDLWMHHERVWPERRALRERVEGMVNAPGVRWHGGINQVRLAELQQASRVWWYPTDFPEVSCITGMEAQAAGLAIVTSRVAELPGTVGDHGDLMPPPGEWTDGDRDRAVTRVVDLLTDEVAWTRAHRVSLAGAGRFGVSDLGDEWDAWLRVSVQMMALAA